MDETLALPAGADKQNTEFLRAHSEAFAREGPVHHGQRSADSIVNDTHAFLRQPVPRGDFTGDHAGIGNDDARVAEDLAFENHEGRVLGIPPAQERLPLRPEGRTPRQPCGMDPVPGAVHVASRGPVEAQADIEAVFDPEEGGGEGGGGVAGQACDGAVVPCGGGPLGGSDECGFKACGGESAGEAQEVGLGAAGFREAAAHEGDPQGARMVLRRTPVLRRLTHCLFMNQNSDPGQPRSLLYAIGAGIGGSGLDAVALESLLASHRGGFLGMAVSLSNRQTAIPAQKIATLALHPSRLLGFLPRPNRLGARKQAVDRFAAARLATGRFDFFHGWSGDCLASLRTANRLGIPCVLEIPTWHRNKGKQKPDITMSERQRDAARFPRSILNAMLITRQRVMEEYARATLLLVLSQKARETFLAAGLPEEKLFMSHRGVDPEIFHPAPAPPAVFRAIFVGSLLRRKGVPELLSAWREADLPGAELLLAGATQPEVRADLERFAHPSIRVLGHVADVAHHLRQASIHVFPSELEGSAKCTYEAAACGLPQITTREAGDVVVDGINGWIIPPRDPAAVVAALRAAHANPDMMRRMGAAGRGRVLANFTWDHFRARLLEAYRAALASSAGCVTET
jgi:glycosyltransferase involved in cell wall biosynthesis